MTHEELEQVFIALQNNFLALHSEVISLKSQYNLKFEELADLPTRIAETVGGAQIEDLLKRVTVLESKYRGAQLVTGNRDKGSNG